MASVAKEKRSFPRLSLKTQLRYRIRGLTLFNNAISDNLSLGGMSFINDGFIPPQTAVSLEIKVLSRVLNPIGKITWSQPLAHSDRYRIGVQFQELHPLERNFLSEYLDMQIKEQEFVSFLVFL